MKSIRVKNFKSVADSEDFELRPLTVLAGINSSGKSTLLQSMLLLKQTLESGTLETLKTTGPYVVASEPIDLARGKKRSNVISISLSLDLDDVNPKEYVQYAPIDNAVLEGIDIMIEVTTNGITVLNSISCVLKYSNTDKTASILFKRKQKANSLYTIKFSSPLMVGLDKSEKLRSMDDCKLTFHSFIPIFAEWERNGKADTRAIAVTKSIEQDLMVYFTTLFYIGPQRIKPELAQGYSQTNFRDVGIDGQYARFLYEANKSRPLQGYDGETLQTVCNHWVCEKMGLARSMDVQRDVNKLYRTIITNEDGLSVDLCQMGFGLSQILPLMVQGLLIYKGNTLIVEDPDVHMHPKVQALLVDFFIDMVKHGRRVVIETHSDHIVTRLRRRIADGTIAKDEVNLTFVENGNEGSKYRFIDMESDGSFVNELPEGFLDVQENDFIEIISHRK